MPKRAVRLAAVPCCGGCAIICSSRVRLWRRIIGLGAARDKVRVACSLEFLPTISEAFRTGQVSYSKVLADPDSAGRSELEDGPELAGETSLDNLVQICTFHHRLVHEGGYGVRVSRNQPLYT